MSARRTDSLEGLNEAQSATDEKDSGEKKAPEKPEPLVELNYPEPTTLSQIVRDVAKWSGHSFVMEPGVSVKLQIFAPRRMSKNEAWELFLTSLSVVSLRAVQVGRVVKIVASGLPTAA